MKTIYRFGHDLYNALGRAFFDYKVYGLENMPEGGALIASNHVSFLDPPMIGAAFPHEIYFLARKTLFSNPAVTWLYGTQWNAIPVDQDRPDFTSLKTIIKLLRSDERVLLFPEGERSLNGQMAAGEAGVGLIIEKTRVPVIPTRIFGAYEALPRGASLPKRSDITVVIGEPIQFSESDFLGDDKREIYQRLSDRTMSEIAKIENPRA